MKAKIATLTISAFLLVSLISIIGIPLASAENDRINLVEQGNGIAEFTNLEHRLGSTSVAIIKPSYSDVAEVQLTLASPLKLSGITGWSYWVKGDAYWSAPQFNVDTNDDGSIDVVIAGSQVGSISEGWNQVTEALNNATFSTYMVFDYEHNIFKWYRTWDKVVEKYGDAYLIRVDLGYGNISSSGGTAYFDDFVIVGSGETFELEGPTQAEQVEQEKNEKIASLEQEIDEQNQITDELTRERDELNRLRATDASSISRLQGKKKNLEEDLNYWMNLSITRDVGQPTDQAPQIFFIGTCGVIIVALMMVVKVFAGGRSDKGLGESDKKLREDQVRKLKELKKLSEEKKEANC